MLVDHLNAHLKHLSNAASNSRKYHLHVARDCRGRWDQILGAARLHQRLETSVGDNSKRPFALADPAYNFRAAGTFKVCLRAVVMLTYRASCDVCWRVENESFAFPRRLKSFVMVPVLMYDSVMGRASSTLLTAVTSVSMSPPHFAQFLTCVRRLLVDVASRLSVYRNTRLLHLGAAQMNTTAGRLFFRSMVTSGLKKA